MPRSGQPQPAQGRQDAEMRSALADDEEEKQPDVDFSTLPDPVEALGTVLTP